VRDGGNGRASPRPGREAAAGGGGGAAPGRSLLPDLPPPRGAPVRRAVGQRRRPALSRGRGRPGRTPRMAGEGNPGIGNGGGSGGTQGGGEGTEERRR